MDLVKATIEILGTDELVPVQFNPNTLAFRKDAVVAEIALPGLDSPPLQFVRNEAETLELELFCDTTHEGMAEDARDVRDFTRPIRRLIEVDPARHSIPVVRFAWGDGLSFTGVVVRLEQSFTLFSPAGVPLRARLALKLKESKTLAEQRKRPDPKRGTSRDARTDAWMRLAPAPLHDLKILRAGKPIAAEVLDDVIGLTFGDAIEGSATFALTVNNWDDSRSRFKYADAATFDPGRAIEIRLRVPGAGAIRRLKLGTIASVRQQGTCGLRPTLLVTGGIEPRRRIGRSKRKPLELAYAEHLLEFAAELRRSARGLGRARARLEIGATGKSIGTPELKAGVLVEIHGVGKRYGGRYHVTRTTHTIEDAAYTTSFECRKDE